MTVCAKMRYSNPNPKAKHSQSEYLYVLHMSNPLHIDMDLFGILPNPSGQAAWSVLARPRPMAPLSAPVNPSGLEPDLTKPQSLNAMLKGFRV